MTIPGVVIVGGAHGTLALARSLGALHVPVHYITHDSPLPGWSRFVKNTIRWSGPHDAGAMAFLRDMAEKHHLKGCLLVPSGDGEVQLVSQHRDELSTFYKIVLPDWSSLQWLCEKPLLYKRAAELGVSFPRTYAMTSSDDADALDVTFPVILKPNMGGGDTAISRAKVIRADDRQALKAAFAAASGEIGAGNVVVQEPHSRRGRKPVFLCGALARWRASCRIHRPTPASVSRRFWLHQHLCRGCRQPSSDRCGKENIEIGRPQRVGRGGVQAGWQGWIAETSRCQSAPMVVVRPVFSGRHRSWRAAVAGCQRHADRPDA